MALIDFGWPVAVASYADRNAVHSLAAALLLSAILGGLLALLLIVALVIAHKPRVGLAAIGLYAIFYRELAVQEASAPSAGGVAFSFANAVAGVLLVAACFSPRGVSPDRPQARWDPIVTTCGVVLGASLAFSFVRGVVAYGAASAITEARPFFYIGAALLWSLRLARLPPDQLRGHFHWWSRWICVGLALVACLHIVLYGFGSTESLVLDAHGNTIVTRPLTSGQSVLALFASIYIFGSPGRASKARVLAYVGLVVVVLAQSRTVWVAAAAAIGVLLLTARSPERVRTASALAAASAVLIVLAGATDLLDSVGHTLQESLSDPRTYAGRVQGWETLIDEAIKGGPATVLAGLPFGHGYARMQQGRLVDFSPHNWYVTTFLRCGLLGLFATLAGITRLATSGVRSRATDPIAPIVVGLAVYFWPYNFDWYLAPFLALSVITTSRSPIATETRPERGRSETGSTRAG